MHMNKTEKCPCECWYKMMLNGQTHALDKTNFPSFFFTPFYFRDFMNQPWMNEEWSCYLEKIIEGLIDGTTFIDVPKIIKWSWEIHLIELLVFSTKEDTSQNFKWVKKRWPRIMIHRSSPQENKYMLSAKYLPVLHNTEGLVMIRLGELQCLFPCSRGQ